MISLYFQPSAVLAMKSEYDDDGNIDIIMADSEPYNFLPDILSVNGDSNDLTDFFVQCRKEFGSREDFYIILPDSIFLKIDIFRWENENDIVTEIVRTTEKNLNDIYYACSYVCTPVGQQKESTCYVIDRHIIDNISAAAVEAKIRLVSIEAASVALIRTKENFNSEALIFESFAGMGSITAYSGVSGAFKFDNPILASDFLDVESDSDTASAKIGIEMIKVDNMASDVYETYNPNVPYYILTDNPKINKLPCFEGRLVERTWPDYVNSAPMAKKIEKWLPLLGTVLQNAPDQEKVYKKKPVYMTFTSGNLLPAEAIKQTNALQMRDKTISGIKYVIAALLGAIVIELGMFVYFSSVTIPESLEADYKAAFDSSGDINTEMELISTASSEDAGAIKGFSELLKARPPEIGFVRVEISSQQESAAAPWMTLSTVSTDPIKFQDYLAVLSMNPVFRSPAISRISSDSSGAKIAEITSGRGGNNE